MENVIIRHAIITDLPKIQELDSQFFRYEGNKDPLVNLEWPYQIEGESFLKSMILGDNSVCLIVEVQGVIIGFLNGSILHIDYTRPIKRSQLLNIFIREDWRDKGIGRRLVNEFFSWSKEKGAQKIAVMVLALNQGGIEFYKALGFYNRHLLMEASLD